MALTKYTLSGQFTDQQGDPIAEAAVIVKLTRPDEDTTTGEQVSPDREVIRADAQGNFSIDLWPNTRGEANSKYHVKARDPSDGQFVFNQLVVMPAQDSDLHSITDLAHDAAGAHQGWQFVETAGKYSTLAQRWANEDEDVNVVDPIDGSDTGEKSAKHWAKEAQSQVTEKLVHRGTWDASTASFPADPEPVTGDFYVVSAQGTISGEVYRVRDVIVYNGGTATANSGWDHQRNSVYTVAGKTGDVSLVKGDVGLNKVTNDAQLKIASNLADLNDAPTARGNLGLDTAATKKADQNLRKTDDVEHAKHISPDQSTGTKYALVFVDGIPGLEEQ